VHYINGLSQDGRGGGRQPLGVCPQKAPPGRELIMIPFLSIILKNYQEIFEKKTSKRDGKLTLNVVPRMGNCPLVN